MNVLAIVNVSQVVARGLIAAGRNGSIVNIASLVGGFSKLSQLSS